MISGKARGLFLKWFREEKLMSGFDDHSELVKIFAVNEWLKTQGYAISTKSSYYNSEYSATVSFNEGDISTGGLDTLENALIKAIEISVDEFNDSYSIAVP